MDGSFYMRPESVVHFGIHDLCDDPVNTGLQHTRPERPQGRKFYSLLGMFIFSKYKKTLRLDLLNDSLSQDVSHLVLVDRCVPVLCTQVRCHKVVDFLPKVLIGWLKI